MARFVSWLGRNADGLIALLLAVCIGVLGLADVVGTDQVSEATLLILAVMAVVLLRDRLHGRSVEREVKQVLHDTSATLELIPERLAEVRTMEETVARMRAATEELAGFRVLHGWEVAKALEEARKTTGTWMFKGGTGTYIRAVTLPECVAAARREARPVEMRLEIIDPTNEDACGRYARFRTALAAGPDGIGEIWTLDRTRKEAFATIVAACWYRQQYDLLDIDVRLSSVVTTFRWDLSSSCIIITQEDPHVPALLFNRGTSYYDRWSTELRSSFAQARQVVVADAARAVQLSDEPTAEMVRNLFVQLKLPLPKAFSDGDISQIIQKAIQAVNPYR